MASGFSLGAAIGATGKFPKLKAPEVDTSVSDRQARELQAIRDSLVSDKSKFHNVYIGKNEENLKKNISELLQAEKTKDPNVIEKAYNAEVTLRGQAVSENDIRRVFEATSYTGATPVPTAHRTTRSTTPALTSLQSRATATRRRVRFRLSARRGGVTFLTAQAI